MGGVWCRSDRGHSPSYDPKGPFSSTISRWTDHVRQVYRKPKARHRPPKPPQMPIRIHDRLNISPPQIVTEPSSDGWRTATLIVPKSAPVPPPRKKKRRLQELARTAYSMDDLNTPPEELSKSTFSLQERYSVESGLDSRELSSTIVVTPVLESRANHKSHMVKIKEVIKNKEEEEEKTINEENITTIKEEDNKTIKEEDIKTITEEGVKTIKEKEIKTPKEHLHSNEEKNSEGEIEDSDEVDLGDEIIPVENETMFTYRALQYSNLGYIDKLSAISEVSAESGFDDRRYSERSESVASDDILTRDEGLNILEHIQNKNIVGQETDTNIDVREKTAKSKKEWLENILKDEPAPYFIPVEKEKNDPQNELLDKAVVRISGMPVASHGSNVDLENSVKTNNTERNISPSNHESPINHSVLLGILQKNENSLPEAKIHSYSHEGESIFLTNTKTNIIYKSLSSDNLTDDYENDYPNEIKVVPVPQCDTIEDILKPNTNCKNILTSSTSNPLDNSSSNSIDSLTLNDRLLNGDSTKAMPDDEIFNVVSTFDIKDIVNCQHSTSAAEALQTSDVTAKTPNCANIIINLVQSEPDHLNNVDKKENNEKLSVKEQNKKSSAASSRRSSLTDSLHEFEISIYDMLKESNKYQDSSDEEESIKSIKAVTRH